MNQSVEKTASSTSVEGADLSFSERVKLKLKDPFFWSDWLVVISFIVVIAVFGIIAPSNFLTLYNLNNILVASAIPAIIAVGQTFAVATAGIDLAVSSNMTLGAVTFGIAFVHNQPIWLCLLLSMLSGLVAGIISGFIIAKRKINDFIVTLGMLSVSSGIALILSDGRPKQIISQKLATLAIGDVAQIPYLMFISIAIVAIAHFVLFHTRFGTHV